MAGELRHVVIGSAGCGCSRAAWYGAVHLKVSRACEQVFHSAASGSCAHEGVLGLCRFVPLVPWSGGTILCERAQDSGAPCG